MMPHITIASLQLDDNRLIAEIAEAVRQAFQLPVKQTECHLDPAPFYNPNRNQYNADLLLKELEGLCPHMDSKIVAVTDIDLFTPILSYIFGQAYLGGRTAIVSGYRMRNERYGLEADDGLYRERVIKGVIHELGHAFGLRHCIDPVCVMVASTYVEEVDLKSNSFCSRCRAEIVAAQKPK